MGPGLGSQLQLCTADDEQEHVRTLAGHYQAAVAAAPTLGLDSRRSSARSQTGPEVARHTLPKLPELPGPWSQGLTQVTRSKACWPLSVPAFDQAVHGLCWRRTRKGAEASVHSADAGT